MHRQGHSTVCNARNKQTLSQLETFITSLFCTPVKSCKVDFNQLLHEKGIVSLLQNHSSALVTVRLQMACGCRPYFTSHCHLATDCLWPSSACFQPQIFWSSWASSSSRTHDCWEERRVDSNWCLTIDKEIKECQEEEIMEKVEGIM